MRLRLILPVLFRVRIWTGQGCQKCRVFRESMENPVLFCCFRREYPPNRAASHWKGGCRWVRRRGAKTRKGDEKVMELVSGSSMRTKNMTK